MSNFTEFFYYGMDREIVDPKPIIPQSGITINLGAGNKKITGAYALDLPEWDGEKDKIPFNSNSVKVIHAYHFLEHLTTNGIMNVLKESDRVLQQGGYMNITVPYYSSQIMAHDITHKTPFCEDTWKVLFAKNYYDNKLPKLNLVVTFNMIMGIVERNICLFTQLTKV